MSSCPGYKLEDYIKWDYNLLVENTNDVNFSVGAASALGLIEDHRVVLTEEQFSQVIAIFEPCRKTVECYLCDFDEENQSWRDYCGMVDDSIAPHIHEAAKARIIELKNEVENSAADNSVSDSEKNTIVINGQILDEKQTSIIIGVLVTLSIGLEISPNKEVADTAAQLYKMVK